MKKYLKNICFTLLICINLSCRDNFVTYIDYGEVKLSEKHKDNILKSNKEITNEDLKEVFSSELLKGLNEEDLKTLKNQIFKNEEDLRLFIEKQKYHKSWEKLDTNKDGKLNLEDFGLDKFDISKFSSNVIKELEEEENINNFDKGLTAFSSLFVYGMYSEAVKKIEGYGKKRDEDVYFADHVEYLQNEK